MPKRVIDGEALWRSRKLKSVSPEYRMHYANWLPMANYKGVFEACPDTVWATVYAFLLPGISEQTVQSILDEFSKAGLLKLWESGGRKWGYFVGIDRAGRLPPKGHHQHYSDNFPEPPQDHPGTIPEQTPDGLGLGLGLGLGKGKTIMLELLPEELAARDVVKEVFDYYIAEIGKNPSLYTLTPERRQKGAARLNEALDKVVPKGDMDKAIFLMKCAIDAMRDSDFHQGKNDRKRKYLDWDLLFRSADKFEKWLEEANQ